MHPERVSLIMSRLCLSLLASVVALLCIVWFIAHGAWFCAIPFGIYTGFMIWIAWTTGCLVLNDAQSDKEEK